MVNCRCDGSEKSALVSACCHDATVTEMSNAKGTVVNLVPCM